jgi:hypothetical protein
VLWRQVLHQGDVPQQGRALRGGNWLLQPGQGLGFELSGEDSITLGAYRSYHARSDHIVIAQRGPDTFGRAHSVELAVFFA